jgi:hypothetical protein
MSNSCWSTPKTKYSLFQKIKDFIFFLFKKEDEDWVKEEWIDWLDDDWTKDDYIPFSKRRPDNFVELFKKYDRPKYEYYKRISGGKSDEELASDIWKHEIRERHSCRKQGIKYGKNGHVPYWVEFQHKYEFNQKYKDEDVLEVSIDEDLELDDEYQKKFLKKDSVLTVRMERGHGSYQRDWFIVFEKVYIGGKPKYKRTEIGLDPWYIFELEAKGRVKKVGTFSNG